MRKLWPALALAVVVGLIDSPARAGEAPILNGCGIQSINPAVTSTATDADCQFTTGTWITMQCDAAVYYRKDGTDPTTASPKVNPGDPYPMIVMRDSSQPASNTTGLPVRILAVSGTANCNFFRADP